MDTPRTLCKVWRLEPFLQLLIEEKVVPPGTEIMCSPNDPYMGNGIQGYIEIANNPDDENDMAVVFLKTDNTLYASFQSAHTPEIRTGDELLRHIRAEGVLTWDRVEAEDNARAALIPSIEREYDRLVRTQSTGVDKVRDVRLEPPIELDYSPFDPDNGCVSGYGLSLAGSPIGLVLDTVPHDLWEPDSGEEPDPEYVSPEGLRDLPSESLKTLLATLRKM